MSAQRIIEELEAYRRNLAAELELADLTDEEYRRYLETNGYETEGPRWTRDALKLYLGKIDRTLAECRRRLDAKDLAFFSAMRCYGDAKFLDGHERLERYADRWSPAIRSRQRSNNALPDARAKAASKRRKIDDARYVELASVAKNDKDLARQLGVSPSTLARYKSRQRIS